jgi:hypothetical protein
VSAKAGGLFLEGWRGARAQGSSASILYSFLVTIPQEAPLPHSARTIVFLNPDVVCLAYEADHVLFSLDTMSTIEITSTSIASKPATSIGSVGKGAFTGLGGYMTLGLGAKLRPCITNVGDDEALVAKDSTCITTTARLRLITLQTRASSLA